jgi:hypothetical protein
MNRSLRSAAFALGVAACLVIPAEALGAGRPAPNLTCEITPTNEFYTGTYNNVVVPPNQFCELSDATVRGNVTVETAASLDLGSSGTVGGDLLVGSQAGAFEDSGWVINGAAIANGAGSLGISGTVHGILANQLSALTIQSATIDGSVVANQTVYGGFVAGSVIKGQLAINGTTAGDDAESSVWFIAGPQLDSSPQEIDGNVVLTNNQSPIYIFDNHIKQNLVCAGNTPAPFNSVGGFGNTVDGRSVGQCATTNTPPVSADATRALNKVHSALAR